VEDGTRPTVPVAEAVLAAQSSVRMAKTRSKGVVRAFLSLSLIVAIYLGYQVVSTYLLMKRGEQLEDRIKSETLTDADRIWQEWTEVSKGRSASFFLYRPRRAVGQKMLAAANHVIAAYRTNDAQPIYQRDWEHARAYLAEALTLDPGDNSVRGNLRLCEGHIARIVGTARHNGALLNEAAEKFNEAQQLMPKSPDPELGLARLYVYGFKDIDKAYAALQGAERRGYALGNREKGQLADGYRERADRLWNDSRKIRGLPQEKDEVQKAVNDYNRALELYQQITPYGNASTGIIRVQAALQGVKGRLLELQGSGYLWR
jgi:hypothetical protein